MPFRGSLTSREQVAVYEFSWPAVILIPLVAVLIQIFIPVKVRFLPIIDLPFMVTIFFAVARRNPISGCLTGCVIGLMQDLFAGPSHPLGMYGIALTIIGYMASSLGLKIDVENPGSRFIITYIFFVAHQGIYYGVAHGLLRQVAAVELEPRRHLRAGQRRHRDIRVQVSGPASSSGETVRASDPLRGCFSKYTANEPGSRDLHGLRSLSMTPLVKAAVYNLAGVNSGSMKTASWILLAAYSCPRARQSSRRMRLRFRPLPPKPSKSANVTIAGDKTWVDTGMDVNAGDKLHITATGTVNMGNNTGVTPNGVPRGWVDTLRPLTLPSAGRGALVGRIGNSDAATPFLVGADGTILVPFAGRLYLGINQDQTQAPDGKLPGAH